MISASTNVYPHAENLPKLLFKADGSILAVWGAANPNPQNKYAGLIYYSQSFDGGKTWSGASPLVKNPVANDQRYFDLKALPNGQAAIVWLDARKSSSHKGSALYFATTEGKNGFGEGHLIQEPCCECCRTNLSVDRSGNIHVVYRAIIQDSIRDMVYVVSHNGGKTFSAPLRISADDWVINSCPHSGPSMTLTNSNVQVAWFTGGRQSGILYARLPEKQPEFISKDTVSHRGRHPQITTLGNGNILISWEEPVISNGEVYSRIGLEQRNQDGKVLYRNFVTPENARASYPVLQSLKDGSVLLAYTVSEGKNTHVAFQKIDIPAISTANTATAALERPLIEQPARLLAISNAKDPACGMALPKEAADTILWEGKVIGFCSPDCKTVFKKKHFK